jgi:hypothetical protein
MYVRFELSHAGTCSIWKAGSPPPMMTFWIITSTSVGGHLLVSSEFIFALDEMTHCSKKHNVWQAGTIHGCLWCTWSEIWSMLKDLVITVSSRWWTGKKKTWTAKPTCQLLNLDQSTSWQCQKPRLYMFILLTRWFPPSYVVGWFWPHELFWCVYHKASQSLDWLLVNKRTVASVMRCHEMSWVNCTFQLLLVKCQLIVVNWPAGAPIWSAAWFSHRKLRPPSREMFRPRSGWRWNDGAETWRTWGTWAIC